MAAMGHSIAEVMLKDGKWTIVADSPLNRRITAEHRNADLRPRLPAMR